MTAPRIALALAVAVLAALYFAADLDRFFTLAGLRELQAQVEHYTDQHPVLAPLLFLLLYVILVGLSLPVAAVLTLAAGAFFGLFWGTVLASFGSTIGATLAFVAARFLFRDTVERRFPRALAAVNRGMQRDGVLYLFMLRLVPVFPFFIINAVMALTRIRLDTFFLVSQVGMLAATIIFVNAGTQLARITSPADVLSPGLLLSLALLGIFPLAARFAVDALRRRRGETPLGQEDRE